MNSSLPFESAKQEIRALLDLLKLEREAERAYFKAQLTHQNPKQRKNAGLAWYPVRVKETGFGLGDYPYVVVERHDDHPHLFQGGQSVAIFSEREREEQQIQGTVQYLNRHEMKVTCLADEHPDWLQDGKIGVNLLMDESSFREMERALKALLTTTDETQKHLLNALLGYTKPLNIKPLELELAGYNPSQREAIGLACGAQDFGLIHGPPGTGKTTTLMGIMRELCQQGERLLVCAPSNAAVDLLTQKALDAGLRCVRMGHLSRIDEALFASTLEGQLERHSDLRQIKKLKKQADELRRMAGKHKRQFGKDEREQRKLLFREAKAVGQQAAQLEEQAIEQILGKAQIVTATLVGAAHRYLDGLAFDTAIVDEAGQGLEAATWIPILKARKAILAGDPLQLPPTVKQVGPQAAQFAETLLEKSILSQPSHSALLQTQYRMNNAIMGMSNVWFYDGKLQAHPSVAQRMLAELPGLAFVDTAGCGFEEDQDGESLSYRNAGERELLRKHLSELATQLAGQQSPISCGVISPYKEQVKALQADLEDLSAYAPLDIRIQTVDAFQGQEQDVIYLSLVRSNTQGKIGFLSDYRRMNVAMTRAKMRLVIIGDSATIGQDDFYAAFLAYAEQQNAYHTAWEWMN